ncbi:MAG: PqqD family protein [Clostridia bacterium]|nr:PqqD family protein [Clostridia bacterium]
MKVKNTFILRNIAGSNVVLPMGASSDAFSGMMSLNETGVFLWNTLKKDVTMDELVNALLSEYNVSAADAKEDAAAFVETLRSAGVLDE